MRVLIVEDDVKLSGLLCRGLHEKGAVAEVATSGEHALALTRTTTYDAVVLDLLLPGIDGIETCRCLRSEGIWTPVLMVTARDSVDDHAAAYEQGVDEFLVKPFSFSHLLGRLEALASRGPLPRPN